MDQLTLKNILIDELKANHDDDSGRFLLPHGTRLTVFLATDSVVVPVPKIDGVAFCDNYMVLEGDDGRFFTEIEGIVAVRADEEAGKERDGRVGFG